MDTEKKVTRKVYLDYASTTPVDPRVIDVMAPYFSEKFGNPSSAHTPGQEAKEALQQARKIVAQALNAGEGEIIFTSSATESNNLAVKGAAWANKNKGRHILISPIEHDCVLQSALWLEKMGFRAEKIPVDTYGLVNPAEVEKRIRGDTVLVSVMHANNEIGTIQPVKEIGEICRKKGILFHTDAAQTFGKIPLNAQEINADLITASSHKMYGPKGVGALFVRKGVNLVPLLHGGGHEKGFRSSTVNVAGIVGFAKAVKLCLQEMEKEGKREERLRDKLINRVLESIPGTYLNGHPEKRLPNNVNFWFNGIEGESIVFELDSHGISASTGSACSSEDLKPSHVLLAVGLKHEEAHGSLRLTIGRWTTEKDVDRVLEVLPKIVKRLRKISPLK